MSLTDTTTRDATTTGSNLDQLDDALIGLRHLWSGPLKVDDPRFGSVDMSTVWIVDRLSRRESTGQGSPDRGGGRPRATGRSATSPGSPAADDGLREVTIRELAAAIGVVHSTASRLIDRAEASGMVARRPARSDARSIAIGLTDRGRALAAAGREFRIDYLNRVMGGWTPQERHQFANLFARFSSSVQATPPPRRTSP